MKKFLLMVALLALGFAYKPMEGRLGKVSDIKQSIKKLSKSDLKKNIEKMFNKVTEVKDCDSNVVSNIEDSLKDKAMQKALDLGCTALCQTGRTTDKVLRLAKSVNTRMPWVLAFSCRCKCDNAGHKNAVKAIDRFIENSKEEIAKAIG